MLKKHIMLFAGIFATSLVLSCDMQMPETVAVKTSAKYEVPLGTAKYDVTESLSSETIIEKVQDAMGSTATLYDFIPSGDDSDVLAYLIRYPAYSVPVDIGEYLEGLNLKDALNKGEGEDDGLGKAFSFTAGSPIEQTVTQTVSLGDVSTKINDSMKVENTDPMKIENIPEISGDSTSNQALKNYLPSGTVKNTSDTIQYRRVYYSEGYIQLEVSRTDSTTVTSGYDLQVVGHIVDEDGTVISSTNNGAYKSITSGETLKLPLNVSVGIPPQFKIVFDAKATGGNGSTNHTFSITPTIKDTKLSKIEGLYTTAEALGIDNPNIEQNISLGENANGFKSIEFSNAPVTITAKGPEGWTGIDCTITPSFEGSIHPATLHAVTVAEDKTLLINKAYTLDGTITPSEGDIKAKAEVTFKLVDATLTFKDNGQVEDINVDIALSLKDIDKAIADVTKLLGEDKTKFSLDSVDLPETLLEYVKIISFQENATDANGNATGAKRDGFGLKTKVTNTLPTDVELSFEAFKLGRTGLSEGQYFSTSATLKGNTEGEELTLKDNFEVDFTNVPENTKTLDFTAELKNADNMTLQNITLGKEYSFGLEVEDVILDWDSVSLKLAGVDPVEGEVDLPFDLSSLMEGFDFGDKLDNIQIETLPVYFYAQKPSAQSSIGSLFSNIKFNASMYASYKEGDGETEKYLDLMQEESEASSTKPSTKKEISFVDPVSWPEKGTQINEASFEAIQPNSGKYSFRHDLKDILNNRKAKEMQLAYNIDLGGGQDVTVRKVQLEGETNVELAIDMAAILKFKLGLTGPIAINLMELADEEYNKTDENGNYSDLFDREKDDEGLKKYADYADSIKQIGVKYRINNELLPDLSFAVNITDEASGLDETLTFATGQQTLKFDGNTIKSIMTSWPFHPQVEITLGDALPAGKTAYETPKTLAISRSGLSNKDALSANIILFAQADENSPISLYPQD